MDKTIVHGFVKETMFTAAALNKTTYLVFDGEELWVTKTDDRSTRDHRNTVLVIEADEHHDRVFTWLMYDHKPREVVHLLSHILHGQRCMKNIKHKSFSRWFADVYESYGETIRFAVASRLIDYLEESGYIDSITDEVMNNWFKS